MNKKGKTIKELAEQTSAELADVVSSVQQTSIDFEELLKQNNISDYQYDIHNMANNMINSHLNVDNPMVSSDLMSYRNNLLSQELPYQFESWDISKRFVSEHLMSGTLGNLSSPFLSDNIINSLNSAATISPEEHENLVLKFVEQKNVYSDQRDKIANILANKNGSGKIAFDNELTQYKKELNDKLVLLNDEDVSLGNQVGQAFTDAQNANTKYINYKNYADKMLNEIDNSDVYSTGTAHSSKTKVQEEKAKIMQKLKEYADKKDKALKLYENLVAEEKAISQNKKAIEEVLSNPQRLEKETHEKLAQDINELNNKINATTNDYKTEYAKTISNKVNSVWDNTELSFKDLSKNEYNEALKTVTDPMAKDIVNSAYALDTNSGKYKKSEYFIWEDRSTPNLANNNDLVTIKGVTNLAKNDTGKINAYFTMVDAADKKVEDFYKRKHESDKTITELNKIKKVIEDYKDIHKKQSLETQLTTAKHIQQIMNGDVSIAEEVANADSETAQAVGKAISENSKLRGPIVSLEGTMQQYSWLNDSEVSLIGQDALAELKSVQGLDDRVAALIPLKSKPNVTKSADDMATEYANKIKQLFTPDDSGKSLADTVGLDLNTFKYKVDTHLASLNMLNNSIQELGNPKQESNVRAWLTELSYNNDMPAATKLKAIMGRNGYQNIDEIPTYELKNILKESASNVSESMNNLDWEILNAIKQAKDNNEATTPELKILNEARSQKGYDTLEYNDLMDKGTTHKHSDSNELRKEADDSYYEDMNKHRRELDINDRVYLMKERLITDDNDRIISKIQQKELAVLNADVQNTHMAVKVQTLGRNLTANELTSGVVTDGVPKPIPIEHFSEFYNLMSLNQIRGEKSATPFTNEEWSNGSVTFGDKTFKASQFYEYYNKDIRTAQNESVKENLINVKKEELNNKLRKVIESEKQIITYKHRPRATGDVKRPTMDMETAIPLFSENLPDKPPSRIFKSDIDKIITANPMEMGKDKIPATVDNIMDLADEYNARLPQSIFDILDEYDNYNPDIRSNNITPDDAIEFFKYKQNQLYTDRLPNGRTIYIPKPTDPAVKELLEDIKDNSEYSALRRKKDALTYDVVSIDGDYVTTRASRWVSPKDLDIKLITKNADKMYKDMNYAQKVLDDKSRLSHEINFNGQKVNISKAISNYKDSMLNLVESDKMKTSNILLGKNYFSRKDLYTKFLGNRYEQLDGIYRDTNGKIVNESVPIQSIANKTMAQFEWMIRDPAKARELSSIGEQAVIESLSELDPVLLNKNMAIKGISDAFENPSLMAEAIEDSISELMKGKVLKFYMQDQNAANDSGLIRIAKKSLQINQQEESVEGVQSFLRRMVNIVNGDKDLNRFYGDISKYVNDKQFIKTAMRLESAGDISFEKLFDDIQLKSSNGEFSYDDPLDIQTLVEQQLKMNDHTGQIMQKPNISDNLRTQLENAMHGYKNTNANEYIKQKLSLNGNDLSKDLRKEIAYVRAEQEVKNLRRNNQSKKTKSDVSDKYLIDKIAKENEAKYNSNNATIHSFVSRAKSSDGEMKMFDKAVSRLKDKYNKSDKIVDLMSKLDNSNSINFVESFQSHLHEELKKATENSDVKIKSMRDFANNRGFEKLKTYIDMQENNNGVGIRAILSNNELAELAKTMKVSTIDDFQQLALLAHVVPDFDMEISGKDSTGNAIKFNLKDMKLNHNDEPGLTIKDNLSGEYVQIANSKSDVTNIERMNTLSRNNLDIQKKNITINQADTPIFLKLDPNKIAILPEFKGDYDKITSIGGGKFGKYDPIQSLLNTSSLLNKADNGIAEAVTLDYETTGLPKLGDRFRPVQAAIQKVNITKGENGYSVSNEGITNIFLKPTEDITNHLNKLSSDDIAKDLNSDDSWIARNYAKYDMPEAANNLKVVDDKVFFTNPDNTLKDSGKTVKEFADQINQSANKVVEHLNGAQHSSLESVIPSSNIYDSQADFMKKVISSTSDINGNPLPVIAHNFSNAEMPWTEEFLRQSKSQTRDTIGQLNNSLDIVNKQIHESQKKDSELTIGQIVNDEYDGLVNKRDELTSSIKQHEKTLKKLDTPIVKEGIDTIHIAKMAEPGRTDYRLGSLISDKNIESVGPAHLGDVDIINTTKLFNNLVNQPQMQSILESADKPLQKNDIIIKHNTDSNGIQFNKGLYQLIENPKKVDNGIEFKFKDLESKSGNVISVISPNMGTMNRDATRNWIRFAPENLEVAKAINDEMVKVDSLRTLNNAMGDANIWKLYKTRAQEGGNQGIINRLSNLKTEYDKAVVKSVENYEQPIVHGVRSFGSEPFTDMEHFVLGNTNKLDNSNFNNEINRLSQPVSDRRMKEYNNVGNYANTHEGKMVERYLNRAQDRLNAKVINKDEYNAFTSNMIDIIKNVKADHNTGLVEIKDNITLGNIDGDILIKLGGGADKLKDFSPRRFNLDLTDSSTLRKSIWNFTNQIGVAMKNAGAVASTEQGKMKALNKYVLPILQESKLLPTGGQWDNIAKIAANMDAKADGKISIPKDMENMLQVAVDHIIDNKHSILSNPNVQHLQEVDMFRDTKKGSDAYNQINKALSDSLKELDYRSAFIPNGEGGIIHSQNVQRVNTHLTDIAKTSRLEADKMTGGTIPFLNVMTPSQAVHKKEVKLDPLVEYNNYNPVSTDLARKTATQIKQEADALKVDREVWTPEYYSSKLKYNGAGTPGRKQAVETMPEYTNIIRNNEGQRAPDYISSLNDNVLSQMQDAERDIRQGIRTNRAERASMYKELANRASAPSRFRMNNYDERIPTINEVDATKINAMKALGWAQDNNGKLVSGSIGLPGMVGEGQLDPSKVLLTTRARLGSKPSGHYTGLALTDVPLNELRALSENNYTSKMERNIISRYLSNNRNKLESVHTDAFAESNYYRTQQGRRIHQYGETGIPVINHKPQPENSAIKELNDGIIDRGRQATENSVERSQVSEAIEGMRSSIKDIGSEARSAVREIFNSRAAIATGVGLAFVGALALARKQHSSDGGTPEQKANGKGAPTVDGNYDNGYNNNDKAKSIATQKTARVEENGKGMTVSVRAKNPGKANDQQVQDAITGAVNSSIDTKITIHNTDDRSTINGNFVSDIFSHALGR